MKKKISLLLCVLIMTLSFAGCSDKKDTAINGEDTLTSSADFIITNFSAMGDADFESFETASEFQLDYTMMQTGLKISGQDFVGMIGSWKAAEEECGEYVSHGDYEVEAKSDGYVVSTTAQYKDREATISFSFDESMAMKAMDVSAKFSIGEILTKAGLNTLLGMGTVFVVLIFLAFLISLLKYIPALLGKKTAKTEQAVQESKPVVAAETVAEETDDLELIAVITAAIAAQEGTSTDGFVVRSIRRRPSNNWN